MRWLLRRRSPRRSGHGTLASDGERKPRLRRRRAQIDAPEERCAGLIAAAPVRHHRRDKRPRRERPGQGAWPVLHLEVGYRDSDIRRVVPFIAAEKLPGRDLVHLEAYTRRRRSRQCARSHAEIIMTQQLGSSLQMKSELSTVWNLTIDGIGHRGGPGVAATRLRRPSPKSRAMTFDVKNQRLACMPQTLSSEFGPERGWGSGFRRKGSNGGFFGTLTRR